MRVGSLFVTGARDMSPDEYVIVWFEDGELRQEKFYTVLDVIHWQEAHPGVPFVEVCGEDLSVEESK